MDNESKSKVEESPRSFATALVSDEQKTTTVIAQGAGFIAEKIESVAREHDIPVLQDFALSQNLSQMPIGSSIPEPMFQAISGLLEFIFTEEKELEHLDSNNDNNIKP